jgi:hypothetical protein
MKHLCCGILALLSLQPLCAQQVNTVEFNNINDSFLFNFVNQNATIGFDEVGGIGTPASGAFIFQSTSAAGYEKRVMAVHQTPIDFSQVKQAKISIYMKGDQVLNAPVGNKYKAQVRFGFLADPSLANVPLNTDAGVNFGNPKIQDVWKVNGGFMGDGKVEYDNKVTGATTKLSLEIKGHAGGNTEAKVDKQELNSFDPDAWYLFELTFSRGLTTTATFNMSYRMILAGTDGSGTTVLQSSAVINMANTLMNNDTTVYPAILLEGEKNTPANAMTFPVDRLSWEIQYIGQGPTITQAQLVNNETGVLFNLERTVAGQTYTVEASEHLSGPWNVIGTFTGAQTQWGYSFFGPRPARAFYRLRYIKQ